MDLQIHTRWIDVAGIRSAFTVTRSANYVFNGEAHDFWEMVYVSKGEVGVAADNRIFHCCPGTVIFHKPNEFHRIWNDGAQDIEFTVISFEAQGMYLRNLYDKVISLDANGRRAMKELQETIACNGPDDDYMAKNFRENEVARAAFCVDLERFLYLCAENEEAVAPGAVGSAAIFTAAVNRMYENIAQPIKIQEIADELHVSLSQLKRVFQKYTLKGVHEYFLALKIEKAKRMLADGESVCRTAAAVGFYNQNYFSAAFKREVGVTPSEWARNAHKP
jgi:AraC-like DNA-binding protein